ncbi:hypothetical protein AWC03_09810 [Mycobacterium europaeum]|nr:hypothetical protein AWC03_09810 [Mycobacterium europaeum]
MAALAALRDALACAIDQCQSKRDLAALSRQFTSVLEQIDALPPLPKRRIADEIADRRAARRARAAGVDSAKGEQ